MPATYWKPDPVEIRERNLGSHIHLHRLAGKSGYWCMPKRSSIDKRYFAEINRNNYNADGSYKDTNFNLKLGTGDTPLEAAANGYKLVMPDDVEIAVAVIDAKLDALIPQLHIYREGRERYLKLTAALDDLTNLLGMVKTTPSAPADESPKPRPAKPDEDDDL